MRRICVLFLLMTGLLLAADPPQQLQREGSAVVIDGQTTASQLSLLIAKDEKYISGLSSVLFRGTIDEAVVRRLQEPEFNLWRSKITRVLFDQSSDLVTGRLVGFFSAFDTLRIDNGSIGKQTYAAIESHTRLRELYCFNIAWELGDTAAITFPKQLITLFLSGGKVDSQIRCNYLSDSMGITLERHR